MITDVSEFKKRLQDIQQNASVTYTTLPSNEPRLIIDANSREISIPVEFDFLAVKNDHKAETIYFEIDRYFDNHDLSEQMCVIQWENQKDEGISPCTTLDVETFAGKIIFGWEITSDCTRHAGDLRFSVRFYSIDDIGGFIYNFNTLPAVSKVLDTLDSYGDTDPVNPSTFQVWVDRLYLLEKNCITKDDLDEIEGTVGENGLSAYEIWLNDGHTGTETDFLNWLKGQDGSNGKDGVNGKTPYIQNDYWYIDGTNTGVKAKGADGKDGLSGKDGTSGKDGKSAYETWIEAGHSGSEDDFLQWLKGDTEPFGDVVTSIDCGGIVAGTSLNGKTIKEVLVMLLGVQDAPKSVVDQIMDGRIPAYSGTANLGDKEVTYTELDADAAAYNDEGFYVVRDDSGNISNAGYQIAFEGNNDMDAQTFAILSNAKIIGGGTRR